MSSRNSLKKNLSIVVLGASLAFPFVAHASASDEVMTAAEHAGFSAAAKDIKTAHAHLHHVLNCLVGPSGNGYDAKAFDPCKGKGNGAIPDAVNKGEKKSLQAVAKSVRKGLASNDLKAVKKDAMHVEAKLKAMKIK